MSKKSVSALVARTKARQAAGLIPDYSRHKREGGRAKTARKPLPCKHLGPPTGETRPCQGCGGKTVAVPLLACATYGVCTTNRVVKLADGTPVKCCAALCAGYAAVG